MSELAEEIRRQLRAAADPDRAVGQQRYMKSVMPFLGVRVPDARRIARRAARNVPGEALLAVADELWDNATHREERYAATMLLAVPQLRGELVTLPVIEEMIREGRWWDHVDELSGRLGELLDRHQVEMEAYLRAWSTDPELWIRRAAILSQLQRGERSDPVLLSDVIEASLDEEDFFIRKAIGWALRAYARHDAEWVREFARAHPLSPLSRREAFKHLGAEGAEEPGLAGGDEG